MARKVSSAELSNQLIDLVAARASFLENPGAMHGAPVFAGACFALAAGITEDQFADRARTLYRLAVKSRAERERQRIVSPGETNVMAAPGLEQSRAHS